MTDEHTALLQGIRDEIRHGTRRICACLIICSWGIALMLLTIGLLSENTKELLVAGAILVPAIGFIVQKFVQSMRRAIAADRLAQKHAEMPPERKEQSV